MRAGFLFPTNLIGHCSSFRGPFRILAAGQEVPSTNFRGTCVSIVCFRKPSAAHVLQGLLPRVLVHKGKTFFILSKGKVEQKVVLRRSYVGTTRRASANLPQTFGKIRWLVWSSWLAVGNCFSSMRCASCTQQHLSDSTVIVSPCSPTHAN